MGESFNSNHHSDEFDACKHAPCWPVIIFVIFAVIVLIVILFSSYMDNTVKTWTFFITLIVVLIWGAILWFLCKGGQHAAAWFLLLLPLAIAIFWFISAFLASATTSPQCVMRGAGARKHHGEGGSTSAFML